MSGYEDIMGLSRPADPDRKPISRHDRAAQFSSFAALTGYEAAVGETARLTDDRLEADDLRVFEINDELRKIADNIGDMPEAEVTFFVPDERKSGGRYVTFRGRVRIVDEVERVLIFNDRTRIAIDDIYEIRSLLGNDA